METQGYKLTVSADGTRSEIRFPHLSYSAYSGAGSINPWFLTRCLESGRFLSLTSGFCHGRELISAGGLFVLMRAEYSFKWKLICSADRRRYFPYRVEVAVHHVGRSSVVWRHNLVNQLDNQTLVSLDATMVHINRKTRKPVAFPLWFLEKYGQISKKDIQKAKILIPDIPPSPMSFSYSLVVMSSSVDVNAHVNNSEYVRFALDCVAAAASRKDLYTHVKGDVRSLWLQDMTVYYRREGFEGDNLTVTSWEGTTPGVVICVVTSSDDILTVLWIKYKIKAHL